MLHIIQAAYPSLPPTPMLLEPWGTICDASEIFLKMDNILDAHNRVSSERNACQKQLSRGEAD